MEVRSIFYYPIKGCGGVALDTAQLDEHGIVGDREFMLVDEEGKALSQREVKEMARIHSIAKGESLEVTVPDAAPLLVAGGGSHPTTARIFGLDVAAIDMGDTCAAWFTRQLNIKCRLVKIAGSWNLGEHKSYRLLQDLAITPVAPERGRLQAFPLHITCEKSLDELNEKQTKPVSMDRFRPNIVIDGEVPYGEDEWCDVEIATAKVRVNIPSERCVVTTIDQQTARSSKEPLATLAAYRRLERGLHSKVAFGVYASVAVAGKISRGDAVIVSRTRSETSFSQG